MARKSNRSNLYEEVTAKIIDDLEDGRVPWVQPWGTDHVNAALGLPRNATTHRPYSGINILILWGAVIEGEYSCQHWLTLKQGNKLKAKVRKGERGTTVCYADKFIPKDEKERAAADGDEAQARPFLKRFTVFNVDQFEGLPESAYQTAPPLPEREIVPAAEALIEATGADFRIGGNRAFYQLAGDFVQVPPPTAFPDQTNFYGVSFHELGHWSRHPSRLDRDFGRKTWGDAGYAREELVSEMCAAFVCAELGIKPTVRHADYLGHWIDVLREDNRAIFQAASHASKAADYLLQFRASDDSQEDAA
ncbi:MAG: ArdC family protein [Geminicoccaceae bacterium]